MGGDSDREDRLRRYESAVQAVLLAVARGEGTLPQRTIAMLKRLQEDSSAAHAQPPLPSHQSSSGVVIPALRTSGLQNPSVSQGQHRSGSARGRTTPRRVEDLYQAGVLKMEEKRRTDMTFHEQEELSQCTFAPKLDRSSSRRHDKDRTPFWERMGGKRASELQAYRQDELLRKSEELSLQGCTYQPAITRKARRQHQQAADTSGEGNGMEDNAVFDRLYNTGTLAAYPPNFDAIAADAASRLQQSGSGSGSGRIERVQLEHSIDRLYGDAEVRRAKLEEAQMSIPRPSFQPTINNYEAGSVPRTRQPSPARSLTPRGDTRARSRSPPQGKTTPRGSSAPRARSASPPAHEAAKPPAPAPDADAPRTPTPTRRAVKKVARKAQPPLPPASPPPLPPSTPGSQASTADGVEAAAAAATTTPSRQSTTAAKVPPAVKRTPPVRAGSRSRLPLEKKREAPQAAAEGVQKEETVGAARGRTKVAPTANNGGKADKPVQEKAKDVVERDSTSAPAAAPAAKTDSSKPKTIVRGSSRQRKGGDADAGGAAAVEAQAATPPVPGAAKVAAADDGPRADTPPAEAQAAADEGADAPAHAASSAAEAVVVPAPATVPEAAPDAAPEAAAEEEPQPQPQQAAEDSGDSAKQPPPRRISSGKSFLQQATRAKKKGSPADGDAEVAQPTAVAALEPTDDAAPAPAPAATEEEPAAEVPASGDDADTVKDVHCDPTDGVVEVSTCDGADDDDAAAVGSALPEEPGSEGTAPVPPPAEEAQPATADDTGAAPDDRASSASPPPLPAQPPPAPTPAAPAEGDAGTSTAARAAPVVPRLPLGAPPLPPVDARRTLADRSPRDAVTRSSSVGRSSHRSTPLDDSDSDDAIANAKSPRESGAERKRRLAAVEERQRSAREAKASSTGRLTPTVAEIMKEESDDDDILNMMRVAASFDDVDAAGDGEAVLQESIDALVEEEAKARRTMTDEQAKVRRTIKRTEHSEKQGVRARAISSLSDGALSPPPLPPVPATVVAPMSASASPNSRAGESFASPSPTPLASASVERDDDEVEATTRPHVAPTTPQEPSPAALAAPAAHREDILIISPPAARSGVERLPFTAALMYDHVRRGADGSVSHDTVVAHCTAHEAHFRKRIFTKRSQWAAFTGLFTAGDAGTVSGAEYEKIWQAALDLDSDGEEEDDGKVSSTPTATPPSAVLIPADGDAAAPTTRPPRSPGQRGSSLLPQPTRRRRSRSPSPSAHLSRDVVVSRITKIYVNIERKSERAVELIMGEYSGAEHDLYDMLCRRHKLQWDGDNDPTVAS